MKIKVVVIDVETPAWLRRTFSLAIPLIGVLVAGVVLAQPKQWATGDPLTAADLNHINVLEVNGVKYSVGATHYCGIGPVQTTGHIAYNSKNGFPAAKALCEASSGCNSSPTAHMCDAAEIARSLAVGDSIAAGWYSTETMAATTSGNNAFDCYTWSLNNSTDFGAKYTGDPGGLASVSSCSSMQNVLCCD